MRVIALAATALLLGGCATTEPASPRGLGGDLAVSAAASLTETFRMIADAFEDEHPDLSVTLNFGGSSALAEGIRSGAPVDVFAAASPATMAIVTDAALVDGEPADFASNTLEIAVPAGNPGQVTGLADFTDPEKTIALCAAEVPCGAASAEVFAAAGLTPLADTLEEDVKAALTKVRLDEVDAALVYRTDVLAAGDEVEGVGFPEAADAVNVYPIAVVRDAPNPEAAAAFLAFVQGPTAQAILRDAGFGA